MSNGRISLRQMKRLLFFDILGLGLVAMPQKMSGYAGTNGFFALAGGMFLGYLYLYFLEWQMKRQRRKVSRLYVIYGIYFLLSGGYGLCLLSELIKKYLLPEHALLLIVVLLLVLLIYGNRAGLEGRARVYELLFWPMVILLLLLMFMGFQGIEAENLFPLESDVLLWGKGVYVYFLMCGVIQLFFFLPDYVEEGVGVKEIRKGVQASLVWATLVLAFLYELLLGSFGTEALAHAQTPIMIYTGNIIMPGGFLRRQEALIAGVCVISLLAFAGSGLSYGTLCLKRVWNKKWVSWLGVGMLFLFTLAAHDTRTENGGIERIFLFLAPIALVFPFLLGEKKKREKIICLAMVLMTAGIFTGCSVQELEDRSFPMMMSLKAQGDNCLLSYQFMDLSRVSDKDKIGQEAPSLEMESTSVSAAIYEMDMQWGKVLDLNHLKVLLLEESFLENPILMQGLVEKGNSGVELPGNMLVFVAEDNRQIVELQEEMDEDLGSYLEELMQGNPNYKTSGGTTFKHLICDWYNGGGNTVLPILTAEKQVPVVSGYMLIHSDSMGENYIISRVSEEEGLLANLCDGEANALDIIVEQGRVHLENVKVSYEFSRSNAYVLCNVCVSGDIIKSECTPKQEETVKTMATDFFVGSIQNKWKKERVDLTNSFYHLRNHDRDVYQTYQKAYDLYQDDLRLEVETNFRFVV